MPEQNGIQAVVQEQTLPVDEQAGLPTAGGLVAVRVLVPRDDYEKAEEIIGQIAHMA